MSAESDSREGAEWPFEPIYERLVARYKADILEHRLGPGDRVDSIAEIQRKHGVARETAKRVLNMLEQEGYVVQRAGKGSFVTDLRPLQPVWGVVVPFFSLQYEDLLARLARCAAPCGREVRRFYDYNDWEEEVDLVRKMLRDRYEAIVVIPTLDESRTLPFYATLSPLAPSVVLFDHTMAYRDLPFVVQSYDLGVVRAMNYLLERQPGGIAFVKNEGWTGRNMVLELMVETYVWVLSQRRPECAPVVVDRASEIDAASLRGAAGIFCCDDVSAIQVAGRLREQGVAIPEQMSLVSYGNTDLARFFTPKLTSVDPHNEEMAQRLVAVLVSGGHADTVQKRQFVVQPELIVRET